MNVQIAEGQDSRQSPRGDATSKMKLRQVVIVLLQHVVAETLTADILLVTPIEDAVLANHDEQYSGHRTVNSLGHFHKDVESFLDKELKMRLKSEKNRIVIVLEPRKNVSADRKHPR